MKIKFDNLHDVAELASLVKTDKGVQEATDSFVSYHAKRAAEIRARGLKTDFPDDPSKALLQIMAGSFMFSLAGALTAAIACVEGYDAKLNAGRAHLHKEATDADVVSPQAAFLASSARIEALLRHSQTEYGGRDGMKTAQDEVTEKVEFMVHMLAPIMGALEALFPHHIGQAAMIAVSDPASPYQPLVQRWRNYIVQCVGDGMQEITHTVAEAGGPDRARELIERLPVSLSGLYSTALTSSTGVADAATEVLMAISAELNKRATEPVKV